jgi:hypothetical protein
MKNQILNAIFRFHIFDLASKHQLVRFAYLTDNIDKRIVIHFARNIETFRIVVAFDDIVGEWFV